MSETKPAPEHFDYADVEAKLLEERRKFKINLEEIAA
jgi:hypothetical protein